MDEILVERVSNEFDIHGLDINNPRAVIHRALIDSSKLLSFVPTQILNRTDSVPELRSRLRELLIERSKHIDVKRRSGTIIEQLEIIGVKPDVVNRLRAITQKFEWNMQTDALTLVLNCIDQLGIADPFCSEAPPNKWQSMSMEHEDKSHVVSV